MNLEPVTLEGAHVRLEPLGLPHLDALTAAGADPELWRWTLSDAATPERMRAYVEDALADRARGEALPFATVDRATGTVAGSTRFGNVAPAHGRVEIGWTWLARPWQRTALNTEAKLLMLGHAFDAWGLGRVELKTDALNARSRAAILRLGATEEGTLRHHMTTASGRRRDTVYFSILAAEWPGVRARLTERLRAARPART
jgi:RimJ/RimL family protein N-acetyltransferase